MHRLLSHAGTGWHIAGTNTLTFVTDVDFQLDTYVPCWFGWSRTMCISWSETVYIYSVGVRFVPITVVYFSGLWQAFVFNGAFWKKTPDRLIFFRSTLCLQGVIAGQSRAVFTCTTTLLQPSSWTTRPSVIGSLTRTSCTTLTAWMGSTSTTTGEGIPEKRPAIDVEPHYM